MIPLLFGALLAQATPAPASPAAAASAPAIVAPDGSAAPVAPVAPRFEPRAPQPPLPALGASPAPGDALIVNSGSTNTAPYTIAVHPDGTADVSLNGATIRKQVGSAQARWLFAKLNAAGPLAALPRAGCMKSASFGTSTTIAYAGSRTPDLSCPGGDAVAHELARTAGVIVNQLGIQPLTPRRRFQE